MAIQQPSGAASAITETSGPASLTVGAVADGQFLKRSGATIVGGTAGSTPPTEYFLFSRSLGTSSGPGAARRIRTALVYAPPMNITHVRWRLSLANSATERMDIGLYSMSGNLLAHTGAFAPDLLADAAFHSVALTAPYSWAGGSMILAWTSKENAISAFSVSNADTVNWTGADPYYGYPVELASVGGELPATITLPIGTIDETVGRLLWTMLIGTP